MLGAGMTRVGIALLSLITGLLVLAVGQSGSATLGPAVRVQFYSYDTDHASEMAGSAEFPAAIVAAEGGKPAQTLFHYTDEAGQAGIRASGELRPSLTKPGSTVDLDDGRPPFGADRLAAEGGGGQA